MPAIRDLPRFQSTSLLQRVIEQERKHNAMKPFWKSRTVLLMAAAILAAIGQVLADGEVSSGELQVAALAILGIILRFRTNEGIG